MNLNWIKCQSIAWCPLETVNLQSDHFNNMAGVYIIWHGGTNPRTVRVGQGDIRDRLACHRGDEDVLAYRQHGTLYVTWAAVPPSHQDGVECYLAQRLKPLVGDRFPDCPTIPVNLPWS